MTEVAREWAAALDRQRGHRTHESIAAAVSKDLGITPPLGKQAVQKWTSGASIPPPERVFALERALDLRPGTLSRILGYGVAQNRETSLLQVVGAVVILGLVVLLFMNLGKIW